MNNLLVLAVSLSLIMSISFSSFPIAVYGQAQTGTSGSSKASNANSVVSVSSSVSVPVSNDTLKAKDGMLRTAVNSFLNSGPNVLKASPNDQPSVKTKIVNEINNATQNVEGIEATNAIVGIEVSKALRSEVSANTNPAQSSIITIQTSSTCKPTVSKSIICDNIVTIK